MRIAGRHNGLAELFAELDHLAVEVAQSLVIAHLALGNEKAVVADRLDLEIVVKVCNILNILLRASVEDRTEKLARLAGGTDDQSLAVLLQKCLGDTRIALVVFQIAVRDQAVQVFQSRLVLDKQDLVIGA